MLIQAMYKGGVKQFVKAYWSFVHKKYPSFAKKVDRGAQEIRDFWNDIKWKFP